MIDFIRDNRDRLAIIPTSVALAMGVTACEGPYEPKKELFSKSYEKVDITSSTTLWGEINRRCLDVADGNEVQATVEPLRLYNDENPEVDIDMPTSNISVGGILLVPKNLCKVASGELEDQ